MNRNWIPYYLVPICADDCERFRKVSLTGSRSIRCQKITERVKPRGRKCVVKETERELLDSTITSQTWDYPVAVIVRISMDIFIYECMYNTDLSLPNSIFERVRTAH